MAETKKTKTIKKITEIPNASVKIEVEETADGKQTTTEVTQKDTSEENSKVTTEISGFDSDSGGGFGWKKVFLFILIVVPVGFLTFGGFLFFSQNFNTGFLKPQPKKTITLPEVKPTPTEAAVDKQAYVIEVQNGSGIAGEGARVKTTLDAAGFSVGTVGNADNSNYTDTIITVNDKVPDAYIKELTKTLEERGPVGKVENFATGEDGEVLIIIGSNVSETSPVPTP